MFRGDECFDVDVPWRRVAATPRLRRGNSVETSRAPLRAEYRNTDDDGEDAFGSTMQADFSCVDFSLNGVKFAFERGFQAMTMRGAARE